MDPEPPMEPTVLPPAAHPVVPSKLYLCIHTVSAITAKVPLAMIVLSDCIKRKSLPPTLKCRVVVPTSGLSSVSLWDAAELEELQEWVDNVLTQDCTTEISEVQEDFAFGLSLELGTSRAADKVRQAKNRVASGGRSALERINNTSSRVVVAAQQTIQHRLDVLDQRTHLITATKEATSAAAARMRAATDRAMDNEAVQATLQNLQTGMQNVGSQMKSALSWWGTKLASTSGSGGGGGYSPIEAIGGPPGYDLVQQQQGRGAHDAYLGSSNSGGGGAPAAAASAGGLPTSTNAAAAARPADKGVGGGGASWGAVQDDMPQPTPHFTLDEPNESDSGAAGDADGKENVPTSMLLPVSGPGLSA